MKSTVVLITLLSLTAIQVCCTDLEDPDSITLDEQIRIEVGKDVLKADGNDTTYITAIVPLDAGDIDITFSTSAGKFLLSGGQSISEFATLKTEKYRFAKVLFQADTTAKKDVWITAEVSQARNRYRLSFIK
jgi:hypothetical protein